MSRNRFKHWADNAPTGGGDRYQPCRICKKWRRAWWFDKPLLRNGGKP